MDTLLVCLYQDKATVKEMERQIGVSRSSVYRRLFDLKTKPRYKNRNGRNYKSPIVPYQGAHRLVLGMLRAAKHEEVGIRELAEHCGVSTSALSAWNRGGYPGLKHLEKAGELVDMKLVWVPIE